MSRPTVSVIIPCRNGAATLPATLASVITQRWPAIEILVVENRSTDDSAAVARAALAAHKGPWQVIVSSAEGVTAARNEGFSRCSGDYVQWLDADDTLGPAKIARQVEALESSAEHDIAHGDWAWELTVPNLRVPAGARFRAPIYAIAYGNPVWRRCRDRRDVVTCTFTTGPTSDYLLRLLVDWWAPLHAYLVRRRAAAWLHEHEAWNSRMPVAADREYFTAAALHGFRFLYVPGGDTVYRTRHGSDQLTMRAGPELRAQALADMQLRLSNLPRNCGAPALLELHRFLLQQDRRLWRTTRSAQFGGAAVQRPEMRKVREVLARIGYADSLEQLAKIIAWHVPPLWERPVAILRELHRLGESGAIVPIR